MLSSDVEPANQNGCWLAGVVPSRTLQPPEEPHSHDPTKVEPPPRNHPQVTSDPPPRLSGHMTVFPVLWEDEPAVGSHTDSSGTR